ncbi:hypothetical protein [Clostridium botulinum]|uniref:hypothetical protein n=1 Tax=Clostridium botulinum TaxID=1491 RepID=UPI0004702573|nr:hypothetical protein [Clostridium botulinum]APH23197.1 hypothetical protein NPD1_1318 [Clostridium botulinum]MBN3380701.1 hypothetical protein [Clostridium botulinum]
MYCVIQEIENKKYNEYGAYKKLEVDSITWTINGESKTKYSYQYTGGRFERPIRKAYKISMHKSYREKGKVKKKQWVIGTMGYYNVIDTGTWIGDYITQSNLKEKLQEMNITEEELWDIVYKKLDPLIEKINKEFQKTEEYKTDKKHTEIIQKYIRNKDDFEKIYGEDTYDYCYDVFGTLRNEEMLNNIKAQYKNKQEYERSYYENFKSNYNNYDFGSYLKTNTSNYTDNEKLYLKTIYKAAAMKLHPDIKKDNGEGMKFLNKLKDEWGI